MQGGEGRAAASPHLRNSVKSLEAARSNFCPGSTVSQDPQEQDPAPALLIMSWFNQEASR